MHISNILNNIIKNNAPRQEKKPLNRLEKALTIKSFKLILSNYRSDKVNTVVKILKSLMNFSFQYGEVFPRQELIGDFADITRKYANELLHELADLGLLRIINRGWNTCVYQLHPDFFGWNRFQFAEYFPILKSLCIGLLMSINSPSRSELLAQRILKEQSILNLNKYTIKKDSYAMLWAHDRTDILYADTPESIKMQAFPKIVHNIAMKYKLSLYAMIVITGFDSDTLKKAFIATEKFLKEQGQPDDLFKLFYSNCEKIYTMEDKQINWMDVKLKLKAADCHPGMPLYTGMPSHMGELQRERAMQNSYFKMFPVPVLKADVEAQPVYESPVDKSLKRERAMHNPFLKMFPIPDAIKENDIVK